MNRVMARLGTWLVPVRYALQIGLIGVAGLLVSTRFVNVLDLDGATRIAAQAAALFVVLTMATLVFVGWPIQKTLSQSIERARQRETRMRAESARQQFEARLARALDMAEDEDGALDVVDRALATAALAHPAELLLADSSRAHLVRAAGIGHDRACNVESPRDCVAVRRGQTLTFADSEELDACPHLRGRGAPCSAVCVPVNVLGTTVGVLHAVGAATTPPDAEVAVRLETISTQAGTRIGMLRALQRSEIQAATDPLTGLLNRRSVEDRVHGLMQEGRAFAIALCDLDNFKLLNDTHGHEAGDRALRLFASTVKTSLRPHDAAARYGGEEFLLVFPDCGAEAAVAAVERLREELALNLSRGGTPAFTASFGVSDLRHGPTLDAMLKHADDALLQAKRDGKNRVLVAEAA